MSRQCEWAVASELTRGALAWTGFIQRGEPSPHNLALRDAAQAAAEQSSAGSPARHFYQGLIAHAESLIREDLKTDEE